MGKVEEIIRQSRGYIGLKFTAEMFRIGFDFRCAGDTIKMINILIKKRLIVKCEHKTRNGLAIYEIQ